MEELYAIKTYKEKRMLFQSALWQVTYIFGYYDLPVYNAVRYRQNKIIILSRKKIVIIFREMSQLCRNQRVNMQMKIMRELLRL